MRNRTPPAAQSGCSSYFLFVLASLWVIILSGAVQLLAWTVDQIALATTGQALPTYAWPLISLGQAVLLALPILPLAAFTDAPQLRAAYRTWVVAIGFLLVVSLARLFPTTEAQAAMLADAVLSLLCTAALVLWVRAQGGRYAWTPGALPLALALAALVALPWLAWGALGSPVDLVLDVLAGLGLGLFAGLLLDAFLVQPLAANAGAVGRGVGLGGFSVGVTLTILVSGYGLGGSQILLLLALPSLGFALYVLAGLTPDDAATYRAWLPMAGLAAVAAAAPLAFFDPAELTLLLGLPDEGDVLTWALRAAVLALVFAWVLGLALWTFGGRLVGPPRSTYALGSLGAAWVVALAVYAIVGRPGFYGEQLFVILRDQADVSQAYNIADRAERTRYVYTTLTQRANADQAGLRAMLDGLRLVEYHPYYLVNAIEVNAGPFLRAYLATQPEVDRILNSPHLRPLPAPLPVATGSAQAPAEPPWNITSIGASRVWTEFGVTGKGIVVGQSDSGVQGDHPALRDGYRGRDGQNDYNWLDPWTGTRAPNDHSGHGTHTLGSILGRGGIGVAPDAEWFACVNLERNIGDPGWYLNCMQFMLAPYPQKGDPLRDGDPALAAHVINNSWGCPPLEGCDANSLLPATAALRAAGIFVVASAGNEGMAGCGTVSDPLAIYEEAFSVGAVDEQGNLADFSSRGPVTVDGSDRVKPNIVAPGVNVLSAFPHSTYEVEDGTSMSGPHVAGVVALMWSAQPKLIGDVDTTERILEQTARPYSGTRQGCFPGGTPSDAYGYGLVDAYAAVKAARELP